jgi:ApbE superfamily uncharacterized protein (UPF0280 family)
MERPTAALLPDGRRLHCHHGPIDLIVEALGERAEIEAAYGQAVARFETVLTELVAELPILRRPLDGRPAGLRGAVAHRMEAAARRHLPGFVTPMAAVAGAVADEVLAALCRGRRLVKAYVNNGGDVALHLAPGARLEAAIAHDGSRGDRAVIRHEDRARGLATSGWRGRSFSLGIADAVTVTAADAAAADVAATLIANGVDLPGHPAITRRPCSELDSESDLGERPVTVAVGTLAGSEATAALKAGAAVAEKMLRSGLIEGAVLFLADRNLAVPSGAGSVLAGAVADRSLFYRT